jgi:hypothetical protein
MSALLNTFLRETLDLSQYSSRLIHPPYCLDIASLERATGYFDTTTLPEIFSRWLAASPELIASLSMVNLGAARENPWINSELEAIARQIVPIVFPEADMDQFIAGARATNRA